MRQEKLLQETIGMLYLAGCSKLRAKRSPDDVIQKPVLPANFGLDIPMYTYPLQDLAVSLSEHGSPEGSSSFSVVGYI